LRPVGAISAAVAFHSILASTIQMAVTAARRPHSVACYDFGNISFGQLMDGVDEFYKDFRNKHVAIADAMTCVRDKLKRKSPAALERQLKEFHNASADMGVAKTKGRL
jgi:hypothetical protein